MHYGMQYDPIQGQVHETLKVGNPFIFNSYLLCHLRWELATDHGFLNKATISKCDWTGFLILGLVFFCHVTLNFSQTSVVKSQTSVPYRANFCCVFDFIHSVYFVVTQK